MLDLKFVRKSPETVKDALRKRNMDLDLDAFQAIDAKRREYLQEVEDLKSRRNEVSKQIGQRKKNGEDAEDLIQAMGEAAERIKELDALAKEAEAEVQDWMLSLPNIPDTSVPDGEDDADNEELRTWGALPTFSFLPKEHWELGVQLSGLDFERAAKLTGSRFAVYWGWAAKLERALAQFMLDIQTTEHDYTEVMPPVIVNSQTMRGTGQLPKFEEDLFKLEGWEYYLIPTAEVPLTNLHAGEVLDEQDLPRGYAAFTPCFRSEAGSYGKDTKGLIRQHQFNKVELVRFAHPDHSFEELENLLGHAETVLKRLELPYRVVTLCGGDIGFSAVKTYDLEVWLPGQDTYREISSCSNCGDFQARRAGIRFKRAGAKKAEFLHTLNGSGLAVGRTLVAVLENYQQEDGSVAIPEALKPYMGGLERITPKN
ncbi:serine--tRNA ligase [Desulfohalobium retbaense]|uniref:Serine--tRNA ligase n=1 Tax=Desulfohalobium retbaense (strain ATCC 49708 / DSM 5692 / JCM 16813 / HR100) TaxID=485915 RepID=C8X1F6_DESRD|nr:serine--tRNA ligase [Desulfohalobium retbaense]ACV68253.1 seryl-tRNA synthetase [Desulfohalobium retbaense DSM 5692]